MYYKHFLQNFEHKITSKIFIYLKTLRVILPVIESIKVINLYSTQGEERTKISTHLITASI